MEKAFTSFLLTLLLLHYVMVSSEMTQTNTTTDQLALLSLKSQIISDPFHFLDESWSPATSVCHWVGVTCGSSHQKVKSLNLSNMALTGRIPREFGNLTFLVSLDLESNNFQGNLPQEMARLHRLKFLDLSFNKFRGEVPSWFGEIGRLSYLEILDLGTNHFTSTFHRMNTSTIVSYSFRILLYYTLTVGIIPQEIGNLVNLAELAMEDNHITGSAPISIFNISSLQILSLAQNNLSGLLPREIGNFTKMQHLQTSGNKLIGEIPKEISNLIELEELTLVFNTFSGSLSKEIFNISRLKIIDLSFNNLSGSLPPNIGSILANIERLLLGGLTNLVDLERNNLINDSSLSFLTSLTNCRNLTLLSLYLNPLNGRIPNERFNLSSNKFTGFSGDHVCKLQRLGEIYLVQNQLSGSFHICLGNITSLREIHLGSNKLSSNIPPSLGNLQDIVVLDLSSNNMIGSLPPEIENLKAVIKMDLSMNQFSNEIPREIGELQNLAHLSLRHNKLQGSIPDSVRNIVGFEFLDLSHNNICGNIPRSLEKLQNLKYFNISVNKLYGEIPSGGPFKKLSSQFFIYNGALCGSSRFSVPPCPTSSKHRSNRIKLLVLFLLLGIALVVVPSTFIVLWIRDRKRKRPPQQDDSFSAITRERISYYELIQATDALSESNLIGSGSFGSVYKGVLRSGTAIAVKVFNLQLDAAFKSSDTECEVLCILRHRNLVKVITTCSNLDFKALALEYMPNGSLEKYLYSHKYFLDTKQRLSIMIDVACALEYLHHGCPLPVIHCDLKPSNVLLDEDMVAHLSDFGISKLLDEDQDDLYTKTLATLGYIAPEYGLEERVSTKCDVYSYGVMLLETFTRRKPNEFEGDLSLKQWVSYSLPEAVMNVVDVNLVTPTGNRLQKELDVVASIMQVALNCCAESPARRTNMKDVVGMLQKIKIQLLAY
ncbi:hypothetical protein P3S67_013556 [Capsicum chacoense]